MATNTILRDIIDNKNKLTSVPKTLPDCLVTAADVIHDLFITRNYDIEAYRAI